MATAAAHCPAAPSLPHHSGSFPPPAEAFSPISQLSSAFPLSACSPFLLPILLPSPFPAALSLRTRCPFSSTCILLTSYCSHSFHPSAQCVHPSLCSLSLLPTPLPFSHPTCLLPPHSEQFSYQILASMIWEMLLGEQQRDKELKRASTRESTRE